MRTDFTADAGGACARTSLNAAASPAPVALRRNSLRFMSASVSGRSYPTLSQPRSRSPAEAASTIRAIDAAGPTLACSHRQSMGRNDPLDLLPGTLDLMILKTLAPGPQHGYGIAQRLKSVSDDVLQVGESSLYPALQRLLLRGWVKAAWGASENNRRARYYTLTAAGRKQLASERADFDRLIVAIQKVLDAT